VLRVCQPPVHRVPGTAVFLDRGTKTTPLAMRENVDHNHTLHESAVIISIETAPVPYVPDEHRLAVSHLAHRDAWRKRVFLATAHLAVDAVDYFQLPRHQTVLLGSAIEI
jgi:K+ transporter